MSYRIFTDTSANLPTDLTEAKGITVVPFSYCLNGEEFMCTDTRSFDGAGFYGAIRKHASVSTSQINPFRYEEYMEPVLQAGSDILYIGMSSGISGSFASSSVAIEQLRAKYPERDIRAVDTLSASLGEGIVVLKAVEYLEHGMDIDEAEKRLNEAYDIMRSADAYSGKMVFYGDVAADDMMASSPSSLSADFYLLNYTPETSPEAMWDLPYLIISKCNDIINGIDLLEGTQGEIKNYYKGQALALRGMLLFELTRIYALPYNRDKGASPGVPIILSEESLANKNIRQNTVAECYNAIISDLNESISLLDNTKGAEYHKGRISRWGVMSLLSRVYLYHSDNKKAYDMAVRAIDGAETDGYRLWTNTEYATAWSNDPTETQKGEVLFEIVNTTDNSQGGKTLGHLHSPEGGKDIVVTSYFHYTLRKDKKEADLNR